MKRNYDISIILPSLRVENAQRCIETIHANSYSNYEVILVTDKEYYSHFSGLSWIDKGEHDDKKIGTTYAIHKGLQSAEGKYIVTLSDDARVCPHWDDHMLKFLEALPKEQVILGNFRVFDHTGEMPKIGYYGRQFSMFPIIKKESIDVVGGYYLTDYNAFYSDPDLGMRVNEIGFVKTCPTAFIYHIFNPDELWNGNKEKYWKKDEELFIKKWGHLGEFKGCQTIK